MKPTIRTSLLVLLAVGILSAGYFVGRLTAPDGDHPLGHGGSAKYYICETFWWHWGLA